jgi:hypothetical protein
MDHAIAARRPPAEATGAELLMERLVPAYVDLLCRGEIALSGQVFRLGNRLAALLAAGRSCELGVVGVSIPENDEARTEAAQSLLGILYLISAVPDGWSDPRNAAQLVRLVESASRL